MIVEFKSKYLSYQTTADGDIIEIVNEGVIEKQPSKYSEADQEVIVLAVKHNGNDSVFSLYERYKKSLVDAWGNDTKNWVGKKFTILHINSKMEVRPIQ